MRVAKRIMHMALRLAGLSERQENFFLDHAKLKKAQHGANP